jgi:hypothetical protein
MASLTATNPTITQSSTFDAAKALSLQKESIISGTKKALDDLIKLHSAVGLGALVVQKQQEEENDELKAAMKWRDFLLNFRDQHGKTTLHLAAVDESSGPAGAAEMCRLLLNLGADPSPQDSTSAPILHYSVTTGSPESVSVVRVLLEGGASALTTYEDISALEMAAGAAAAMVDANDSGDGTEQTQSTMEITLDIVKLLLAAAREEAAKAALNKTNLNDDKEQVQEGEEANKNMNKEDIGASTLTTNIAVANLLSAIPSRADYNAILAIGKSLNEKLEEKINGKASSGSGEHVSWQDTTAEDDAAARAKGLANKSKEATFLFDDSMTCAAWLKKGKEEMEAENFEEAASSFYQAMVGAEDGDMTEAQNLLKIAVQSARAAKGLPFLPEVSSSEGEYDY